MKKRWHILQPNPVATARIGEALQCAPIIATLLVNRGITSEIEAKHFMTPSLQSIRPPAGIIDMDAAAQRIHKAITCNEKILIFGDYDADGVTATTLLYEFLRHTGARVAYYIPDRFKEGYGLQPEHILNHAVPKGIHLVITADCGSSSHEAISTAARAGIDAIVTDHHRVPESLPHAVAVVNPIRPDCASGLKHLSGVGVAFYLVIHLRKYLRERNFWENRQEPNLADYTDLVAIGTIADMVPLADENRIFTRVGTQRMALGKRPGLKALMEASGLQNQIPDTEDIAFKIAPRINAAGRLSHAHTAMALLTARKIEKARELAIYLNAINQQRQEIENDVTASVHRRLTMQPDLLLRRSIVLSGRNWHEGVLGIVASKIMHTYFRPVVLISTGQGQGKGSARSIPGIDLYGTLANCAAHLEAFGGHSSAAGLTVKPENIETFRSAFEKTIRQTSVADDFVPVLSIDCELPLDRISPDLIDGIEAMKPFGAGNPEPLFMAGDISILSSKIVGENHRRMLLKPAACRTGSMHPPIEAIQFGVKTDEPLAPAFDRIAFRLRWNRWNGKKTAQIIVEEATHFSCKCNSISL